MRRIVATLLLGSAGAITASAQSRVTVDELLGILDIHVFRVRVPNDPVYVWSIEVLKSDGVKPTGTWPKGLSGKTKLLALRDIGSDQLEFTLPDAHGFSKGQLNLCNEGVTCKGQYSISWRKVPTYSADGDQCVVAEIANETDPAPLYSWPWSARAADHDSGWKSRSSDNCPR